MTSCNSLKYLDEGQSLVRETNIVFKNSEELEDQVNLRYELENIERIKPNSKFFFLVPRDYYHLKNQDPGDTLWYNNFAKKTLAEDPAFLDTMQIRQGSMEMQNYLRNKKGYYNALVDYQIQTKGKKSKVKYTITTNDQYTVRNIKYQSSDPEIHKLLNEDTKARKIKPGDPIDVNLFELEKQRIYLEFQNLGYINFLSKNIQLKGDSVKLNKEVDILFDVIATDSTAFQKYSIGKLNVFTDFSQEKDYPKVPGKIINGKNYFGTRKDFIVKPRSIDKNIFLKPYEDYSRKDHYQTIRKLSELSTYKFVKLTPYNDSKNDTIINYDIFLTPYKYKWISEFGSDAFWATLSANGQRQQLFGFSVSGSLINRNMLGGSEQYKLTGEVGYEFNNSFNVSVQNSLLVPTQVDYLGLLGFFFDVLKTSQDKREAYDINTTTNFVLGYDFRDVFTQFRLDVFKAQATYDYKPSDRWHVTLSPSGFNLLDYEITQEFQDSILINNLLLANSYRDNIFTGLIFKDISAVYTRPESIRGWSWAILGNLELSGGEIFLANTLYNAISGNNSIWRINNNIDFSKFFKIELDYRLYKRLSQGTSFASRINIGYSDTYGDAQASVPYIRQFFVGGPNSLRGWTSREIGPGSFRPVNPPTQRFFQAGDFKFEMNAEYRSDWVWIIEWALFMDAGNIWTLKNDPDRPGSKLTSDFFNEIAVNWGWGIRFDFTYFNVRFDFGYVLKTPFREGIGGYFRSPIGQGLLGNAQHIAVNYPF